jgi:hypothetical protein
MASTVKVPVLGNVPKGGLFAGGLAVVGVGGYLWYKHMRNQQIAAATPGAAGYGYGAAAYGYGAAAYGYAMSAFGYGYGPYGYGFGQYGAGGSYPYPITSPYWYAVTAPQNNPQWTQNATTALVNQGYTGTAILAALGKYIGGKPVVQGSSDDTIIQAAIAIEGYPPQPGSGGYPPGVNYQGAQPGQNGGQVTVPNIHGLTLSRADSILKAAGLKYNTSPGREKKGYSRIVTAQNPKAGEKVKSGTYVSITWHYVKS